MRTRSIGVLLVLGLVALGAGACGGESAGPASGGTPEDGGASSPVEATAPMRTGLGVAGLIPPHYPNATDADWKALYSSFSETGSLVGVYTNWTDSATAKGQAPRVFESTFAVARDKRLTIVAALGTAADAGGSLRSTVDWQDAGERQQFVAAAAAVAKKFHPAFLALGVEVDRLWEVDRAAFDGFVSGYGAAYTAIKAESPGTKVFTVFQLEYMKGSGKLSGQGHVPHWELIDRFAGKLDVVGFTTYPFLDYETPEAIPAGYYAEAAARAGAPIAFTEIGWPSAALASAPSSGFGGSPEEQAAFVRRFFELTRDVHPEFALWAFPFDVGPSAGHFASVALRDTNGTAKPALAAWKAQSAR